VAVAFLLIILRRAGLLGFLWFFFFSHATLQSPPQSISISSIMESRAVVRRELEELSFFALILRPHDSEKSADLMYADDGNIEREVPYEEIALVIDAEVISGVLTEDNLERFQNCLEELRAQEADLLRQAAQNPNGSSPAKVISAAGLLPDLDGRIVCPDGTTILTYGENRQDEDDPSESSCSPVKDRNREGSFGLSETSTTACSSEATSDDEGQMQIAESGCTLESPGVRRLEKSNFARVDDDPNLAGSQKPRNGRACGAGLRGIRALRGPAV